MNAEILLILAGHTSQLFTGQETSKLHPAFAPLLHPGEKECLESLGLIAYRYQKIKTACSLLSRSPSSGRYICALCSTLNNILKSEYETLVVETEAKILGGDAGFVANASFVPLSSIRAVFAVWDTPLATLARLVDELQSKEHWSPGKLIDMLLTRSHTGVHRVADIFHRLCVAVQRVWRVQLASFIIHGTLSDVDPIALEDYTLAEGAVPQCVSAQSQASILYVGRAIRTVKAARWQKQLPRSLASEHTALLESVLPDDQHSFDRVIAQIRVNVSEWLWLHVLTQKDVEDAVDSLANYFLLRNGEFSLSLIREIERLKLSRLTSRAGPTSMIREQDMNLVLLRASLGTTAQHDPSLTLLRFSLPAGPLRPLLPSLTATQQANPSPDSPFADFLLGTQLNLTYKVTWPLDLFLHTNDLQVYGALFGYLSALRKTHTRIHTCWTSLSNAQRARRRWTGLGDGGTEEDMESRRLLLRCGWGVVRDMEWFLATIIGYVLTDVVDVEFRRLKDMLQGKTSQSSTAGRPQTPLVPMNPTTQGVATTHSLNSSAPPSHLDFTTLRNIHNNYLERLLTGCLLTNPALTTIIRPIFEVCERFVAQVERWGGDVLPSLLEEGSLKESSENRVGAMVNSRRAVVEDINQTLHSLLDSFYEQLSLSTSQQPILTAATDTSKSILVNTTLGNASHLSSMRGKGKAADGGEVTRHAERLLLRLDFNSAFSKPSWKGSPVDILKQGGLA